MNGTYAAAQITLYCINVLSFFGRQYWSIAPYWQTAIMANKYSLSFLLWDTWNVCEINKTIKSKNHKVSN